MFVYERSTYTAPRVLSSNPAPRIPNLRDLLEQHADEPVIIPSQFPCETRRIDDGSLWYTDTGAHENLHSNLPPDIMSFTQEPIPTTVSERARAQWGPDAPFRHREVMRQWVESIFTRGNHTGLVSYGTAVELAPFAPYSFEYYRVDMSRQYLASIIPFNRQEKLFSLIFYEERCNPRN